MTDNGNNAIDFRGPSFKDGDGGGDGMPPAAEYTISVADNGFIVTTILEDGAQFMEIALTLDQVFDILQKRL